MATTYTSGLRLTNQEKGANATTWGDIADVNFEHIDDAITGMVSVDITTSSQTLTVNNGADDQARNAIIKIGGIPSSANSVIIPASEKKYTVHAVHTSVSGGIAVRTATGTGVVFLEDEVKDVYCDGVSVYQRGSYLQPKNNLSDVNDASAALVNLGLNEFTSVSGFQDSLAVSNGKLGVNLSTLFDNIWPVGSLYSNRTDGTNPGTLMGFGIWASAGEGRVPIGVGTGIDVNGVSAVVTAQSCGGEYVHTMTTAELVPHTHEGTKRQLVDNDTPQQNNWLSDGSTQTGSTGSGEPFNVMQPWYSVYQWIRTA